MKKYSIIVLPLFIALCFCGCSNGQTSSTETQNTSVFEDKKEDMEKIAEGSGTGSDYANGYVEYGYTQEEAEKKIAEAVDNERLKDEVIKYFKERHIEREVKSVRVSGLNEEEYFVDVECDLYLTKKLKLEIKDGQYKLKPVNEEIDKPDDSFTEPWQ